MVLDPLSAFAVACNILQVVEFGVKALNKAAEYRKFESPLVGEQADLQSVTHSLNDLNASLHDAISAHGDKQEKTREEVRLLEANEQCLQLSQELMDFLDRFRLKEGHSALASLRAGIKVLWSRDKMDAMAKSVSQARDNLTIAFLLFMK